MVRKTYFWPGNRYLRGRFAETRPDDGENYAGWYCGAFASCKNIFFLFFGSKMLKIVECHYIFVDVGNDVN